jgi:hypothetical protein
MFALMTVFAIAFAISRYWMVRTYGNMMIAFGIYLGFLSIASVLPFSSPPIWKRFWTTYAIFAWAYLLMVLRVPDPHTDRVIPLWYKTDTASIVGVLIGFFCAFITLLLPGPTKTEKDHDETEGL